MNLKKLLLSKGSMLLCMLFSTSVLVSAQSIQSVKTINWKGAYVTGTAGYDGNLAAAFDGLTSSGDKYGSFVFPVNVTVEFPTSLVLTQYSFTSVSWTADRSPKSWKVVGSNNGTDWVLLDEKVGYTDFTAAYQTKSFTFTNTTAYRIYRIVITEVKSGTIFGAAEINFPEFTGTGNLPFYPEKPIVHISGDDMYLNRVIVKAVNNSIVLNAAVYTNKTASPITEGGAVYSTTPNPTVETGSKSTVAIASEVYTVTISGLQSTTTYYVRPFATNANGTTYGQEYVVTTANAEGDVFATSAPAKVTSVSAELPVNILDFPGLVVAERGVVWSDLPNPTTLSAGVYVDAAATVGSFTGFLTGLAPGTLYYVRPYVMTSTGVIYGAQQAFYSGIVEKYYWKEGAVVEADLSVESWRWDNVLQKAFNNATGNTWTYKGSNAYLQFSFTSPQVLSQYVMSVNAGSYGTRAPKDWTLVASNDKQNWVVLDTQTGVNNWSTTTAKTFDFTNSTAYNYYRINFSAPQSGDIYQVDTFNFPQFPNSITTENNVAKDDKLLVYAENSSVIIKSIDQKISSVRVFAMSGVCVAKIQGNDAELRINNLAKGVYMVQVTKNGANVNTKVVVN